MEDAGNWLQPYSNKGKQAQWSLSVLHEEEQWAFSTNDLILV